MILHIATATDWTKAKIDGKYVANSLSQSGFIHCSLPHQIPQVANSNFRGQQGLVLLLIDKTKLAAEVKYEDLLNEGELFPHVYGPIDLNAVIIVVPFPPEKDGTFKLPKELTDTAM